MDSLWKKTSIGMLVVMIAAVGLTMKNGESNRTPARSTHEVEVAPFTISVHGRCELRSLEERGVYVPETPPGLRMRLKLVELIEEGSEVKKGQTVARIDTYELKRSIRQLESEIKIAKAALKGAQKSFTIEKNKLEVAVAKAKVDLRQAQVELKKAQLTPGSTKKLEAALALEQAQQGVRHKRQQLESTEYLARSQVASEFDLQQKRLEYLKALAAEKQMQLELEILQRGGDPLEIARKKHEVEKAQIAFEQAQNDLRYKVPGLRANVTKARQVLFHPQQKLKHAQAYLEKAGIPSPADGMVLYQRVWGTSGKEKVKKGIRLWGGDSFLSIQNMTKMQVNVEIPETEINAIAIGQEAIVEIDSIKDDTFPAHVIEIGTLAREKGEKSGLEKQKDDRETRQERVFEVIVKLERQDPRLKPGLTGTVKIVVEKWPRAIVIPQRCLFNEQDRHYVYVLHQGRPERRDIAVEKVFRDQVVVRRGIAEGERIFLGDPFAADEAKSRRLVKYEGREFEVVGKVSRGRLTQRLVETGSLAPQKTHMLHSQIDGELVYIVPEGSRVEKGDKVFTVEKSEEDETLKQSILQKQTFAAEVANRRQELKLAEENQGLEIKKAQMEVALAQFELETLRRQPLPREVKKAKIEKEQAHLAYEIAKQSLALGETLFAKNLLSEVELGRRKLAAEKARAQLEVSILKEEVLLAGPSPEKLKIAAEKRRLAQVKYEQAKKAALSNIAKHRVSLEVSKAQLAQFVYRIEFAESRVKDGTVYAPVAGKALYYKSRWRGKPEVGKECHSGQALVEISGENKMAVKTKVNEVDRYMIREGQSARITLPALPGQEFSGKVISVSQLAVDRSENQDSFISKKFSGVMVFEVQVEIFESSPLLKAGMSAVAEISVADLERATLVPKSALRRKGARHCIYLLKRGRPVETEVQIKATDHSFAAISGAGPGDVLCVPLKLKRAR